MYTIHPVTIPSSHHEIYRYCQLTWNLKTHPLQKGKSSSKPPLCWFLLSFLGGGIFRLISKYFYAPLGTFTRPLPETAPLSRWSSTHYLDLSRSGRPTPKFAKAWLAIFFSHLRGASVPFPMPPTNPRKYGGIKEFFEGQWWLTTRFIFLKS